MTDVLSRAFLPTPLHERTAELCSTNEWTEECGFTVPALYTSAREEENALSSRVALSDLSARECWVVDGAEAAAYLSFATASDVSQLTPGQTARTVWCDDAGCVRGDGVIARFGPTQFELTSSVRDFAWMADGARGFDVKVSNATGMRAIIGVRGPLATSVLSAAGLSAQPAETGSVVRPNWRPAQVALMRDASSQGLDLWMRADDAILVWDRLWRAGAGVGIAVVGARALDVVRIENGLPLVGRDWQPAQLARQGDERRVPRDIGFTPDLTRRFNGVDALRLATGRSSQVLVQLTAEEPLASGPIAMRSVDVGRLTSPAWSESRAGATAIAWLDADAVKIGTKVSVPGPQGAVSAEIARQLFP